MAFGEGSAEYVRRALRAVEDSTIWIGIQSTEGAKPHEPEPSEPRPDEIPTLATVAAVQEYGRAPGPGRPAIPQRSYLRATADAKGKGWLRVYRKAILAYAAGDEAEYFRLIKTIGTVSTGQIRNRIERRIDPPLSKYTVARRRKGPGSGIPVPLIDTSQLINSVRSQAVTVAGPLLIG